MTMPDALIRLHGNRPNSRPNINTGNGSNLRRKLVTGIVAAVTGIAIACIIICIFRRKIWSILSKICCRRRTKIDQDLEAFIRNHGPLALKRYSFSHVKKMTNSFKDKLGQGGYGGVYKGKLSDGHLVAVKLLNTSKGNGQEFINEVASISKTSHVNVISLLGYCLEVDRRVLIYEFMPNGSLEIFIYKGDTLKSGQQLGWEKLYQIAIGIGRGLEYLRRGCSTRILHFDIKLHSILLDEDFCP
ncbi:Receptor-like kinase [Melia azedarach]|uniref:Receptor-like kinase n=1 Tax=Melia azedarach TaxID=155640 RepID=A0ACC1XPL5_MELAZ|nr:Receptor-like kinase [Melia azedarach]